jgi:PAS domain-containing protein
MMVGKHVGKTSLDDLGGLDRFELLLNAIKDYAIYLLDRDGRVATWNAGAQRFKGYSADEIIGQHFSRFYTDEDSAHLIRLRSRESLKPRAGAFEKMALASGPASSSIPSLTPMAPSSVSRRSPAM